MGPGLYSDIGKKARDLLYKDYQTDQKVAVTTYAANGIVLTTSGTKKDELYIGEIQSQLKNENITVDVKANSDSNVFTTVTFDDFVTPGLKTLISFTVPDQKSGKVGLQYLHDYAGVNASIGVNASPFIDLASVVGNNRFAVGVDVSFDTATGNFTKYNAGMSVTNSDLIASVNLNEKGDSLTASYYHVVSPLLNTVVGAQLTHSFSSNENTLTFGTQYALDPLTTVKARINNCGKASALIQHEWRPKSFVTMSAEVDTKAIEKSSKVGLSLLLKP